MSTAQPVIFGLQGTSISAEEREFFTHIRPFGFILFARNIDTPSQVRALVADLKTLIPTENKPILIDQEGGRVARLRPPHWAETRTIASLLNADTEAACHANITAQYTAISQMLNDLGITVNCAPVLDIRHQGCHEIVGDRAFGATPEEVVKNARVAFDVMVQHGIAPVIKHIPGHGRAMVDSHEDLPIVDIKLSELEKIEVAPFRQFGDSPYAMTAHIIYNALDAARPLTLSKTGIAYVREEIGYEGCIMTDDLSMKALSGRMQERASLALEAGCDVLLHCNGDMAEMQAVAEGMGL